MSGDTMPRFIDLTGQVFGRLTVLRRSGASAAGHARWFAVVSVATQFTCSDPTCGQGRLKVVAAYGPTALGRQTLSTDFLTTAATTHGLVCWIDA